ncbi:hypothetical protein GUITHDRAFT_156452 [Guillardia theta CCMP2712]|uniref:Uncharacterized protein n=2 Tax=Guillardia theta (strain CCMP2712) TaxID=905079 RepID=L1I7Q7_GUITC|nr:hypothetical protein GUITHDRAFT_156452 [Guillardia theta CCMP2712]EKX31929.1 hypothetical protein GUITHDRAFT_156452 [Guillardia theta CCMP2712]|eukprot:XP_005818909.1 hypothetical protein GUITHDRAFT_156452 [Guillardia theta CCMP2712]
MEWKPTWGSSLHAFAKLSQPCRAGDVGRVRWLLSPIASLSDTESPPFPRWVLDGGVGGLLCPKRVSKVCKSDQDQLTSTAEYLKILTMPTFTSSFVFSKMCSFSPHVKGQIFEPFCRWTRSSANDRLLGC